MQIRQPLRKIQFQAISQKLIKLESPSPWGFFTVVIFEASEYGLIEIQLFAFKLLGLNMLKYAN